ncbi:MAG TPA: DNA-3-methyladenine glycosylase I [Candidatus Kapabacteria bacterium]|nr:DNA-3-methyladenine glycosylase I [Candidatus Kapabacteria bacterium]
MGLKTPVNNPTRCSWASEKEPLLVQYHDEEWGVIERDDEKLLAKLILDGAQAGLSWVTILRKRDGYLKAFRRFDPEKVARFGKRDIERLMKNEGIVRNRMKIESAIGNARAYLEMKDAGKSFSEFIWQFTGGRTKQNRFKAWKEIPASTKESEALSKALKSKGFTFVGPTIVYAFMQAIGMVNDHTIDCFRHNECSRR